jgi:hypothetical protein
LLRDVALSVVVAVVLVCKPVYDLKSDFQLRFRELLRKHLPWVKDEDPVLESVWEHFADNMMSASTSDQALKLYHKARRMPKTDTRNLLLKKKETARHRR